MNSWHGDDGPPEPEEDPPAHDEPGESHNDVPDGAAPPTLAVPELPQEEAAGQADPPVLNADSLQWGPDPTKEVVALQDIPEEPQPGSLWAPKGPPPDEVSWWHEAGQPAPPGTDMPPAPPAMVPPYLPTPAAPYPGSVPRRQPPIPVWGIVAIGVLVVMFGAVVVMILRGRDGSDGSAWPGTDAPADIGELGEGTTLIVGPTGVVGMWTGSEWQPRRQGDQPGVGFDFAVVGLDDQVTDGTGEAVADGCAAPEATSQQDVSVPLDPSDGGSPPRIAVAGVDDPLPRPVELLDVGAEAYQQAAADVARGQGAAQPMTVTQIVRTDLDGSGTDEVIVAAEHQSDPGGSSSTGDSSIVFLRRVAGDDVATDVLAAFVAESPGDPLDRAQISAVADLNGDGSLELVLSGRSGSGEWTAIHALPQGGEAGGLSEVLRVDCEA